MVCARGVVWLAGVALLAGCASTPRHDAAELRRQVADTEHAFARTLAQRDHASGPTPLRGSVGRIKPRSGGSDDVGSARR